MDLKESAAPAGIEAAKIAFVKPIFTDTAYNNAFYVFFSKYGKSSEPYITTDLNYLNVTVKYGWSFSAGLNSFLASDKAKQQGLLLGGNVIVIDDINVTEGGLFHDEKRAYDILILGFTEYVTSAEYYAFKEFVAQGGTLIILDSCNFQCEVSYSPPQTPGGSAYMSLVKGKGWEFNGTCAWKSVYGRWEDENRNWIGGNYWFYWSGTHYDYFIANTSDPISTYLRNNYGEEIYTSYGAHEENLLQNFTDTSVIGYWHFINPADAPNATVYPGEPVAAYQHRYIKGTVFRYGIMASDRIGQEEFLQAFLICAVRMGFTGEVGDWYFPHNSAFLSSLKFCHSDGTEISNESGLTGRVYCYVALNTKSLVRGVVYNLSAVYIRVFARSGYSWGSGTPTSLATIQGTMTNSNGLSWETIVDTSAFADGDYVFEFHSLFISSVNSSKFIDELLAVAYRSIENRLTSALMVISMSFSALIVACVFLLYSTSTSKKSTRGKNKRTRNRKKPDKS
jgi:hypothetical protein